MKYNIIYIVIGILLFSSCDNYLDVEPKGKKILKTIEDYDQALIGDHFGLPVSSDNTLMFYSSDNVVPNDYGLGDLTNPNNVNIRYYRWDKDLFLDNKDVPAWDQSYSNIYKYNVVINGVKDATGSDELARKRIKAEARVMRSYEYFLLINSFAKQYDSETALADLGVPIVLEADVTQGGFVRATVQEVYDFMIKDLTESLTDLPDQPVLVTRPDKATSYALLARIYLQMGNYEKARENANDALNIKNSLADYINASDYFEAYKTEQYMLRTYDYGAGFNEGTLSSDLTSNFDMLNDKRVNGVFWKGELQWVYDPATGWAQVATGNVGNAFTIWTINHCVSTSEMVLIRAEANARLTDASIQDVVDDLNLIRRNRIMGYVDLSGADFTSKEDVLAFALTERRREMSATGMRWFDLKRLNKEVAFAKTIVHTIQFAEGPKEYTLEPNSNKYVFPIPPKSLNFNSEMQNNPRD